MAIQKRKQIQSHLCQVSKSLEMALNDVKQQQDNNNLLLVEMASLMDSSANLNPPIKRNPATDPLLDELIQLVDGSDPDDSLETLREKMAKSIDSGRKRLAAAESAAKKLIRQRKTRIAVRLTDEKNHPVAAWGLMEQGFNTHWPEETSLTPTKRDFLILSHTVFSIQQRGYGKAHPDDLAHPPSGKKLASASSKVDLSQPPPLPPSVVAKPPSDKFHPHGKGKIRLVLSVRKTGAQLGDVHIQLDSGKTGPVKFVKQLAKACQHTSKPISYELGKVF